MVPNAKAPTDPITPYGKDGKFRPAHVSPGQKTSTSSMYLNQTKIFTKFVSKTIILANKFSEILDF